MYKKILIALSFVLLFIVFDRLIAAEISNLVVERQFDTRLFALMNGDIKADVLVMGSSRSARNIVPSVIEDLTGLKTYSLSFPGTNIDFHETVLRLAAESNSMPKKIILTLDDPFQVADHPAITYRYDYLYPYTGFEPVRQVLCERGKRNCIGGIISKVYAENLNTEEAMKYLDEGKLQSENLTKVDLKDGSMLLDFQTDEFKKMAYSQVKAQYDESLESDNLVEKFKSFVEICKKNSVELYLVFPPLYRASTVGFAERMKEVAGDYPKYLYYENFIRDKNDFYDVHHLNEDGAMLFTREVVRAIKAK